MKTLRLLAVVGIGAALVAVTTFAHAATKNSGFNQVACNDGTVTWSPTTIWPPNHKMVTVNISYTDTDNDGDSTSITVGTITDNQAASDGSGELQGSGQPTAQQGLDWAGTGNTGSGSDPGTPATTTAQVRAERSGTDPSGRTYTIQVMCMDSGGTDATEAGGQMQTVDLTVTVPHDQGKNS